MASITFFEIESIMSKFCYFSSCGVNAKIDFSSESGRIHVKFEAELGNAAALHQIESLSSKVKQAEKPSKEKRRQRRKEAHLQNIHEVKLTPVASINRERVDDNTSLLQSLRLQHMLIRNNVLLICLLHLLFCQMYL